MNIAVKHNGTTITTHVISYERTHKICTGVGILTIEIEGRIGRSFVPWDTIDIYENGDYKNRYYVSNIESQDPKTTITLDCQDKSKRLVDYFIPDQYTIDYPSYTRYWIEKFLTEAGVSYVFDTTSQGQLISNYTSLGLTQAYDQIMMLLQMSGWYMFFDGNGVAIIGSLNKEISPVDANLLRTDILEISVRKDDKMLRNRALVWGNVDPFRMERVFADVSVRTKWNYDSRDLRTMVVSNSNIPNNSSAYGIANQLVKEFSRITIEKHLSVHGARNLYLGDVVKVNSRVYTGKGLITTFGVSMSKLGLITNLILDERCPRLFGFFNFGDYVYVGTYGDGVWRKHMRFEHTWHDFSDGLDDLAVTDLHINNGIFSSVAASGGMYYTLADDEPWARTSIASLDSFSQSGVLTTYSGIMGRATIVDKEFNRILYGADTYSGLNMGDYFLTFSGYFGTTQSGILAMSGIDDNLRGWMLEYNLASGMDVYNSYPIHVSGNYSVFVLDLENDGHEDYVSIGLIGSGSLESDGGLYNLGEHQNQPFFLIGDDSQVRQPENTDYVALADYQTGSLRVENDNSVYCIDNQIGDNSVIISVGYDWRVRRRKVTKTWNEFTQSFDISGFSTTSAINTDIQGNNILGIINSGTNTYDVYYNRVTSNPNTNDTLIIERVSWNADTNSFTSPTTLSSDTFSIHGDVIAFRRNSSVLIGNTIYLLDYFVERGTNLVNGQGYRTSSDYFEVFLRKINTDTGSVSIDHMLELTTPEFTAGKYYFVPLIPGHTLLTSTSNNPVMGIFQDGTNVKILGWLELSIKEFTRVGTGSDATLEYIFLGNSTVLQYGQIYSGTDSRFDGSVTNSGPAQLTTSHSLLAMDKDAGPNSFYTDGTLFVVSATDLPFHVISVNVYPNFSNYANDYIAYNPDDTTWHRCSPITLSVTDLITAPNDIYLDKPFSTRETGFAGYTFWNGYEISSGDSLVIPEKSGNFYNSLKFFSNAFTTTSSLNKGTIVGNWFILRPDIYNLASINFAYLDLGNLLGDTVRFLVLQRENTDFNIVQEASFPIRIDISNFAPLLTVQTVESSFRGYFINDSAVEEHTLPSTFSGILTDVYDYRYTYLPGSGELGLSKRALYLNGTNIYSFDVDTMSGVDILYDLETTLSGNLGRLETSNYVASGQYIFVTTSGDFPMFYQKDNDSETFIYYSGLPDSRATIIRLDDRV